MSPAFGLKPLALLLAAALAAGAGAAEMPPGARLSWDEALQRLQQGSEQLGGARAQLAQRQAQAEGIANLGGPVVSVFGLAYSYKASLDLNLDPLNQGLGSVIGMLPPSIIGALPALPQLPASYTLERSHSNQTAILNAIWPIYVGGAADAARALSKAQGDEAQADLGQVEDEAVGLLAQRYFQTQLARRAADLREAVAGGVAEHDAAVEKMLKAGVVSQLERLQARAALEDARHQARKARSDAELAALALARSVKLDGAAPLPSTPLALSSQALPPLAEFISEALAQHPGLAKVAAKRSQAEQLKAAGKALNKPQVFAFGQSNLTHNRDWVAGLGVRVNLWDSLDHAALDRAHASQIAQVDAADAQARSDIALLVEKQWRSAERAREQYLSLATQDELGRELLRLRQAGLRQGTSTALDLIDAELNLAKLRTERAQVAYDYVMALTGLLQASGQIHRLGEYLARADLRVE
ncbi:outer membrane protein TolC [Paucibacter oligotrophus]|uniref:Outer membrane protein TolC n=1 Tax=Roseateles oligotrophus TaxID=1769250 RepID=A0A840L4M2_9BURK|nr:TolC family protein [Roseateles oligotrophus]MBB4843494.1 outer membrane protein TolC [Roseateles oligotrophus]